MNLDVGTSDNAIENPSTWQPTGLVVPVDLSDGSQRAVAPGAALAANLELPLELFGWQWHTAETRELRRHLDGLATELSPSPKVRVVFGGASSAAGPLIEAARQGAGTLVCMATRARSGVGATVLGSVTEAFVRATSDPVVLVGPHLDADRPGLSAPIVVCVDGSHHSEHVVPVAAALAIALGTTLEVIHVQEPSRTEAPSPGRRVAGDAVESGYVARLATSSGVDAAWEVLHRQAPVEAIVEHARRHASLLALATHGRSGLARVAMGSVAMQVVHDAPCPVLVVRPPHPGG